MTSESWRFVPKHEIWFLVAMFVGLLIAHELSGDSLTWAQLGILVGVTAMVRIGCIQYGTRMNRPRMKGLINWVIDYSF